MNAVITVTGRDNIGIIAKISTKCYEYGANIIDVSQSVMKNYFAMIMLVDIAKLSIPFNNFVDVLRSHGEENNLKIDTMHEDLFNSMHRV